jgi:hypothetical protein
MSSSEVQGEGGKCENNLHEDENYCSVSGTSYALRERSSSKFFVYTFLEVDLLKLNFLKGKSTLDRRIKGLLLQERLIVVVHFTILRYYKIYTQLH